MTDSDLLDFLKWFRTSAPMEQLKNNEQIVEDYFATQYKEAEKELKDLSNINIELDKQELESSAKRTWQYIQKSTSIYSNEDLMKYKKELKALHPLELLAIAGRVNRNEVIHIEGQEKTYLIFSRMIDAFDELLLKYYNNNKGEK